MRILFLLIIFPSLFFAHNIRHLYLTWQRENTSNNITINIHSKNNINELELFYDTESKALSSKPYTFYKKIRGSFFLKERYIFHVELNDLIPGKTYYFIVGDQKDGFTEEKKFKTIPESFDTLCLVEGGDWEQPKEGEKLAEIASKYNPSAILLGGDYPDEVFSIEDYEKWDLWLDSFSKYMISKDGFLIPLILAIGNHDVTGGFSQTPDQAPFFFNYFPQSEGKEESFFLKFFGKEIALFVLDSGHCYNYWGKQYYWLKHKLKTYKNIPIKLALYHVPIYPSVRFAKENWSYRLLYPLTKLSPKKINFSTLVCSQVYFGKKYWLPLFDKYNLTTAFEHHDHTLKRTKPLRYGMIHPEGTIYLGDGGWSPKIQCTPIQAYLSGIFAKCSGYTQFFWLIEISKEKIIYKAISKNNQVIDEYIQKIKK